MNYEILSNKQVLVIKEYLREKQPNGKIVEKTHHCFLEKITLTPDKTTAALNEVINITLQWQLFDLQAGQHFDDTANIQPFKVEIAGEVHEVTPVNGSEIIQFSSTTAGEFEIRTINPNVDNQSIKVVVQDAQS